MIYKVGLTKNTLKSVLKLPKKVQEKFALLLNDLRANGPIQAKWMNYSKLDKQTYHCHLTYKYVACWRNEKDKLILEVYYVGSRENAPY